MVPMQRPGVRAAAATLRQVAPVKGMLQGLLRVRETLIFATQCGLASGLAYWVAQNVFGHPLPFFAPIAAVLSLGVSGGKRARRSFELVLGAAVGVGIGDLVVSVIGGGYWQVALVVFAAIVAATFVDKAGMVAIQAASTGVLIATILPPGTTGALDRMVDAFVGGVIGLVVVAVIPNSALKPVRREVSTLVSKAALVLDTVASGIERGDGAAISRALAEARGTQTSVNAMMTQAEGGSEMVALSPMYWSARRHKRSMMRILVPVDNVMRNARVLARRAEVMVEDQVAAPPELVELIRAIAEELGHLGALYAIGGTRGTRAEAQEIPGIVRNLQHAAADARLELADGTGLSGTVVLAQCRSIIVDALQICGYSRKSAMASLVPTVKRPWVPPEVIE